jgi:succinate dehydrogenase hydrophobic anchor subunit
MFFWIYEIPPLLAIAAFGLAFVSVCWFSIFVSRTFVKSRFHQQPGLNDILGDYLQYFGVIYGLLLGLLAVGTYQNHAEAEKAVSKEASTLAGLYRDVSVFAGN